MICYEIVNPSDAATLLAPSREIALAALAFIGQGSYAGNPLELDGHEVNKAESDALYVPIFISGVCERYDQWWHRVGYIEEPIAAAMRDRKGEVVAALRSCAYGRLEDRRTYESAIAAITDPEKLSKFKRDWKDRRRSSMNRIVQRAWAMADAIEKEEAA